MHRHASCSRTATGDRIAGAFGYWRETGRFVVFEAQAVVLATGGIGKSFKVTSNSWEYTGDGHALALRAGADLIDMEFVQFHPTGMVWPPSVTGLLVTEGVRGDGGILKNSEGKRFMFDYIPEFFKAETADTEEEADRWYERQGEQPPATRAAAARRGRPRDQLRGQGRPRDHRTAASSSTSPRAARPSTSSKRLPSMYHQFKELADVDITKEPMEVGPTCHYVDGRHRVDADTAASDRRRASSPPASARGGMHGSNRLGGNSLSDLLVFGRRAGETRGVRTPTGSAVDRPAVDEADVEAAQADGARAVRARAAAREPLHDPRRTCSRR